jgi:hypothetical protein
MGNHSRVYPPERRRESRNAKLEGREREFEKLENFLKDMKKTVTLN